jgi:hypothetical protein
MLLDVLDDVFLLNLAFEAAERAFDRLPLLNFDFSHYVHLSTTDTVRSNKHARLA